MRHTEVKCAYAREFRSDGIKVVDFLVFYANDSVIRFWIGPSEGAYHLNTDIRRSALVNEVLRSYYCDPSAQDEIYVSWFAGSAMTWRDRYWTEVDLSPDGSTLTVGGKDGTVYQRVKCYDGIVAPRPNKGGNCEMLEIEVPEKE